MRANRDAVGRWSKRATLVALAAATQATFVAREARADEPVAASEPRLMNESGEATTVIDAFDKDDPFDLNLTLGFTQQWKSANIRRETALNQPGLSSGHFVAATENVAAYSQSTSTLNMGADIGLFRDVALTFRLPLILSDSRQLADLDGSSQAANAGRFRDPNGETLFSVPFKSPNRSGIDYILVGADWAIFNQQRDWTKPTWVLGADLRVGVGTPLHACNGDSCPDPAHPGVSRSPGISRGMNGLGLHTIFSRRFGYLEPYTGFKTLIEFAQANSDFGTTNNLKGALLNHPPLQGTFLMGVEIIPWERREQFQRLVADLRVAGSYHSPGREYSELFDALGSSQASSLRNPNPGGYHFGNDGTGKTASVRDPSAQSVYFTGITDQQAYGSLALSGSATWQAGEYIKFTAGLGLTFNQSHLITSADACNPDFKSDAGAAGPCHSSAGTGQSSAVTGIPNPNHRDVIDLPGRRFTVDDTTIVDLWVSGVVMF